MFMYPSPKVQPTTCSFFKVTKGLNPANGILSYTKCLPDSNNSVNTPPNNEAVPNFLKGIRHCFSL